MTDEEMTEFLSFHVINEFMRDDYRLEVVRTALTALPKLPVEQRETVERLTRRLVQTPGFRNSAKAPVGKRVRPTAEAFTKSPDLVAAILAAWAAAHVDLRQRAYDLLTERGWELLPVDADRAQLPGFFTHWPKDEDFEKVNNAYTERYPDFPTSTDNVSLMVVWLAMSLPYDFDVEEEEDVVEQEQGDEQA
jgi:hypothetical protein